MITILIASVLWTGQLQDSDPIARVDKWLRLVSDHAAGSIDGPALEVAEWPDDALERLSVDLDNLIALMRDPTRARFSIIEPDGRTVRRYSDAQLARLRALACIAAGTLNSPRLCPNNRFVEALDSDLLALARSASLGSGVGADNYILKRGALLHTDIALRMLPPPYISTPGKSYHQGITLSDGAPLGVSRSEIHWGIARQLLAKVRPTRFARAAPQHDQMVHDWYTATVAWMQHVEYHDQRHLAQAYALFPDDADILFFLGCEHETYATPYIQNAMRSVRDNRMAFKIQSTRAELTKAETLFRRAVSVQPTFPAARLRLGRVLTLLGDSLPEAERQITVARAAFHDSTDRYFAELFLASVSEMEGNLDAARSGYMRAADLFPEAQSPLLALSALVRRLNDLTTPSTLLYPLLKGDRSDPWWIYHSWQGHDADTRLRAMWHPFEVDGAR